MEVFFSRTWAMRGWISLANFLFARYSPPALTAAGIHASFSSHSFGVRFVSIPSNYKKKGLPIGSPFTSWAMRGWLQVANFLFAPFSSAYVPKLPSMATCAAPACAGTSFQSPHRNYLLKKKDLK